MKQKEKIMTDPLITIASSLGKTPSKENLEKTLNEKQKNIFNIKDIDWKPHSAGLGGERAIVVFDNGYQASIIRGGMFYTDNGTYEIAVLNKSGNIDYTTPITDDVLGYLSEEDANKALKEISEL